MPRIENTNQALNALDDALDLIKTVQAFLLRTNPATADSQTFAEVSAARAAVTIAIYNWGQDRKASDRKASDTAPAPESR